MCACPHLRLCPWQRLPVSVEDEAGVAICWPDGGCALRFLPPVDRVLTCGANLEMFVRLSCAQILFDQAQRSIKQQLHTFIKE